MSNAQALINGGDPAAALQALQQQVRERPADAALRVFLFQLLCVLGQWPRAATQLQVCGDLDAGTLAMVATYSDALACEALRNAVFAGKTTPVVFGQPEPWVASMIEALQVEARGDLALARSLRARGLEAAPVSAGSLDGVAFDWICDADSRLGPLLECVLEGRYAWLPFTVLARARFEAPADLRDLVWAPAQLELVNGGQLVALIPARYAGSAETGDAALQLARRTDWLPQGDEQYHGLGQRVLATSAAECGLLEVRELVFG